MTVYVRCIYNRAAHKGGHGHAYQNTGFYWRECTVKTVLRIDDYSSMTPNSHYYAPRREH